MLRYEEGVGNPSPSNSGLYSTRIYRVPVSAGWGSIKPSLGTSEASSSRVTLRLHGHDRGTVGLVQKDAPVFGFRI